MKKVALLGLVFVLLAVSAVPVLAGGGNGHGNGANAGQNSAGDENQTRQQDRTKTHGHGKSSSTNLNGVGNRMRTPFYLQGTIESKGSDTITVLVIHANARAKQFIGTTLTVNVANAKIYELTQTEEPEGTIAPAPSSSVNDDEGPTNRVLITFGNLKLDKKVAIHGNLVNGVYMATLVTQYITQTTTGQPVVEEP